jgi:hypothetical protein
LNPSNLTQLTLRIPGSYHYESVIELSDVIKLLVPQETVNVLRIQKLSQASVLENFKCPGHSLVASAETKLMVKGIENKDHVDKCLNCKWFPYSVVCESTAIDFVAPGFLSFKYLSHGLDAVFNNKNMIKKLAGRIEMIDG